MKEQPLLLCALGFLVVTSGSAFPNPVPDPINTLQEIGPALSACWRPPTDTQNFEVTVSFSFKSNGEVLGKPRITYSHFNGDTDEQKLILTSILQALDKCTPLKFTSTLGGAVAGRIFTMTFSPPSYKG
jgi:hypothetical protein